jgi:hypothetical protein
MMILGLRQDFRRFLLHRKQNRTIEKIKEKSMRHHRIVFYLLTAFIFLHTAPAVVLAQFSERQFYSNGKKNGVGKWERDEKAKCYKIWWHFKVNPSDEQYERHIAYVFDNDPSRIYFYNPGTKKFWGRCNVSSRANGGASYSELKPGDRQGRLSEIAESAFPEPGKMPQLRATDKDGHIRVSVDGAAMEPPPPPLRVSEDGVAMEPPPSPPL